MSITSEFKQYGETAAEQGKQALAEARKSFYAVVGAYDAAFESIVSEFRHADQLPRKAAQTAKTSPVELRTMIEGIVADAAAQALTVYGELAKRGAVVVHEFRKDPRVQRVIIGAEKAVDSVEESVDELLDDASDSVRGEVKDAKAKVAQGADATRGAVRKAAARNTNAAKSTSRKAPARKAPVSKTSTATKPVKAAPSSKA